MHSDHPPSFLQVELLWRPGTLLEGELHRCCLSMRNSGASPLHNVRMIISHPDVYCPVADEDLQEDVATALSGIAVTLTSTCAKHVGQNASMHFCTLSSQSTLPHSGVCKCCFAV